MKKENGITLIALIITIIVLLILTGVTVMSAINGEGIFVKAREAKDKHNVAVKKEENEVNIHLNNINNLSSGNDGINLQTLTGETQNGIPVTSPSDKGWNLANVNYAIAIGNNEAVPIPKGFYYVGGDINTGIIISDDKEDENKAKKLGEEWSITGDLTQEKAHKSAEKLKGNQFVWIPDETKANYKGFYLGRYEAGTGENGDEIKFNHGRGFNIAINQGWDTNDYIIGNYVSGKITSKANHIPYFHTNYETAKQMNQKMYEGLDVGITSRGFSRSEWEKMTTYLTKDVGSDVYKADINNGYSWGNHQFATIKSDRGKYTKVESSSGNINIFQNAKDYTIINGNVILLTTGSSNQLQKKHLYNISGNLREWEYDVSYLSGGIFNGRYSDSALYRSSYSSGTAYTNFGIRTLLEIK